MTAKPRLAATVSRTGSATGRTLGLAVGTGLLLLAGCIGDSGGSASLSYDGNENGSHSDATKCNADGTFTGSGNIQNGSVHVSVTDGSGHELFSQDYSSTFDAAAQSMHGASATWTLKADRSGSGLLGSPFSGHYTFHLAC